MTFFLDLARDFALYLSVTEILGKGYKQEEGKLNCRKYTPGAEGAEDKSLDEGEINREEETDPDDNWNGQETRKYAVCKKEGEYKNAPVQAKPSVGVGETKGAAKFALLDLEAPLGREK